MALWSMMLNRVFSHMAWLAVMAAAALAMKGCGEPTHDAGLARVTLGGKTFNLELALDNEHRFRGLSNRTDIPADGGMLFVFPDSQVRVQQFVMRDCPNPIDIVYLDRSSRVTATYTMEPEPPRTEAEKELSTSPGQPDWTKINEAYERRLKGYSSRYPAQFVIELRGGTLRDLKVKNGDKVEIDAADLKSRAK